MLPSGSIPLFFRQNIPLYRRSPAVILSKTYPPVPLPVFSRLASIFQACQYLPTCESFNKPLLPAGNTRHQPDTQHGQEKIPII